MYKSLNIRNIIKISQKYISGSPKQRSIKWLNTFPNKELEAKINIEKISDITEVLNNISHIGVAIADQRKEFHHFFSNNLSDHASLILINGSSEVWVKQKTNTKIIFTPTYNLPLLWRDEIKIKPNNMLYKKVFLDTLRKSYIGSFKKECIDFSFWHEGLSFTATLSLAYISNKNRLYQIEIEFDGYKQGTSKPTFKLVLRQFEKMIKTICPNHIEKLNTNTKLEWLNTINKAKKTTGRYRQRKEINLERESFLPKKQKITPKNQG